MTKQEILDQANAIGKRCMVGHLGIEVTKAEMGYMELTMPVDNRTHQPFGLLHGGASAALVETAGSFGSHMLINPETQNAVGVELNINHLKGMREGKVLARAKAVAQGRKIHVWNVDLYELGSEKHIATARLTVMIVEKSSK